MLAAYASQAEQHPLAAAAAATSAPALRRTRALRKPPHAAPTLAAAPHARGSRTVRDVRMRANVVPHPTPPLQLQNAAYMLHSAARAGAGDGCLPPALRHLYADGAAAAAAAGPAPLSGGTPKPHAVELLSHVRAAEEDWQRSIRSEVLALAQEAGQPLAQPRRRGSGGGGGGAPKLAAAAGGGDGDGSGGGSAGSAPAAAPAKGFLFDSMDLLDAVAAVRTPNRSAFLRGADSGGGGGSGGSGAADAWGGLVALSLRTPRAAELRARFVELAPAHRQSCLDDDDCGGGSLGGGSGSGGGGGDAQRFGDERRAAGEAALAGGLLRDVRRFARRGVPPALRPGLWRLMLGLPAAAADQAAAAAEAEHLEQLLEEVRRVELVTDGLYELDVLHIGDDDKYFVFEEVLRDVVMAFTRDATVPARAAVATHAPIPHRIAGAGAPRGTVPPCGVQPFRGLVSYAAPLCFLWAERAPVYAAFRAMYVRYWCRLNAIRSAPGGLLHLLRLFEDLLRCHHPQLMLKLAELGIQQPLRLAMPWIQFGFVGYLEVGEVLQLWDRVLAYDSLSLLPALAAAVFVFRSAAVLAAPDADAVRDAFADGTCLKAIPLLQAFLFPQ
ncbi:hypothetical protein JKP88DRAFT_347942 [Tribonema minus]|uniref:Rab-GAP TBC domain-containing protein n=1 Tax=Tribonema minus TaxID=303371 RepID=A0A836CJW0_9STRA|nr:hypothetical protein JKP88DRAFT_347942 [Tribonema minus]